MPLNEKRGHGRSAAPDIFDVKPVMACGVMGHLLAIWLFISLCRGARKMRATTREWIYFFLCKGFSFLSPYKTLNFGHGVSVYRNKNRKTQTRIRVNLFLMDVRGSGVVFLLLINTDC